MEDTQVQSLGWEGLDCFSNESCHIVHDYWETLGLLENLWASQVALAVKNLLTSAGGVRCRFDP